MKTLLTLLMQVVADVIYRLIKDAMTRESEVQTYEGNVPADIDDTDVERLLERYDRLFEAADASGQDKP